jgi:hypothetical protein
MSLVWRGHISSYKVDVHWSWVAVWWWAFSTICILVNRDIISWLYRVLGHLLLKHLLLVVDELVLCIILKVSGWECSSPPLPDAAQGG